MAYQYVREPLTTEEADQLANACQTTDQELAVWTLLDMGLRSSKLAGLTAQNIQSQQRSIQIKRKGGPCGKRSKQHVVSISNRVRALLQPYFAFRDTWFVGARQRQKIVTRVANRASFQPPGLTSRAAPHIRHSRSSKRYLTRCQPRDPWACWIDDGDLPQFDGSCRAWTERVSP